MHARIYARDCMENVSWKSGRDARWRGVSSDLGASRWCEWDTRNLRMP